MRLQLQHCISNADRFDPVMASSAGVGLEIQDFAIPQVLDGDWERHVEVYRGKLLGFGGLVSVHGAYVDLNPASPDRMIASVTRERYLQSIKAAEVLGASYLVFHSQINPDLKDPKVKDIKISRQLPFWHDLLKATENSGLVMLLENFAEDRAEDLQMLVERVGSPRMKVCLDTGHALTNSNQPLDHWMTVLRDHLAYMHLHWNDGSFDAHQAPGDEFVRNIGGTLRQLDANPAIALEYAVVDVASEAGRVRALL